MLVDIFMWDVGDTKLAYICTVREHTVMFCLLSYFVCLLMWIQISTHRNGCKNVLQ